jgi:hypothetical protein
VGGWLAVTPASEGGKDEWRPPRLERTSCHSDETCGAGRRVSSGTTMMLRTEGAGLGVVGAWGGEAGAEIAGGLDGEGDAGLGWRAVMEA